MNTQENSPFLPGNESAKTRLAQAMRRVRLGWSAVVGHFSKTASVVREATRDAPEETWFAADFDKDFYLRLYPDVAEAGMDPYAHYILHGKAEGRQGARMKLELVPGGVPHNRNKPTILVVSHEASLTGAPILSLNLVRSLRHKYNVIGMLLGDGPLMDAFRLECVSVVGLRRGASAAQVNDMVTQLVESQNLTYAIANSVETWTVLEALAKGSVPSLILIHEFAAYTRPAQKFFVSFFWADEVVFSTRLTYQSVIDEYPSLSARNCRFIPQGRCVLLPDAASTSALAAESERIARLVRPPGSAKDELLIIGVGFVQLRKGVDLFIECAAKVVAEAGDIPCRFVWVGHGYDPEKDMEYSVYLADQIQRHGLKDHVKFAGDTFLIEEVYKSADMLLLTSRLDPLPGVAIEAMSHGLPVVCFDETTGIADVLKQHGVGEQCVVPYLDTSAMAERVVAFVRSDETRDRVGSRLKEVSSSYFDMGRYVAALDALALDAVEKVKLEQGLAKEIHESGIAQRDFLAPSFYVGEDEEVVRWKYVRPWTAGFDRRKPNPGFHPGIYRERNPRDSNLEPLVDYLRSGRPDGPWHHEVIRSGDAIQPLPPGLRVALHLHVYYTDLLPDIITRLQANEIRPDLLVSVPNATVRTAVVDELRGYAGKVAVEVVPNRGRDIGPFLTAFGRTMLERYDIVGHIHTKKTADIADVAMSDRWRNFLLENLLGEKAPMADIIVSRMSQDETIGMAFPSDPNVLGWGQNEDFAKALSARLGLPETLPQHFAFPVGTMFWARVQALRPLLDLNLDWSDYPAEPLPYDGSVLHALERLLPFVVEQQGSRCALTNVAGVTR